MNAPLPPEEASKMGHDLAWDPPENVLSRAWRWTCTVCGHAVIDYQDNIYGSALTNHCVKP